jgi:hypothetical protein
MAGYSGTPLVKKLGIKADDRVLLVNPPAGFESEIGALAPGTTFVSKSRAPLDVILLFVETAKDLEAQFKRIAAKLKEAGGLWVAWPKKSSGLATDLSFDAVQRVGLAAGLVDNKICAIDETWSGLRFVVRVKDRTKS